MEMGVLEPMTLMGLEGRTPQKTEYPRTSGTLVPFSLHGLSITGSSSGVI